MSDGYVDRSAQGLAPLGTPNKGQSPGAEWPGNPNMKIDRSNPNPSDRDMRMDMLYATIERNDIKSEAGEKMMHRVKGR